MNEFKRCPECGCQFPADVEACPHCIQAVDSEDTISFKPAEAGGAVDAGSGPATLLIKEGIGSGEELILEKDRMTIGRNPASDIFLNDITVSRNHAVIEKTPSGYVITDEESLNGTLVNAESTEKAVLKPGDRIQIGRFKMVFIGS